MGVSLGPSQSLSAGRSPRSQAGQVDRGASGPGVSTPALSGSSRRIRSGPGPGRPPRLDDRSAHQGLPRDAHTIPLCTSMNSGIPFPFPWEPADLGERDRPRSVDDLFDNLRSEEHTSELQSRLHLVCRLLLEKKKKNIITINYTS